MSIDELQQVRDANPVARSTEPPPLALLRARVDAERPRPRAAIDVRWRRRRVTVTAAAMAAAIAAVGAFVIGAGSDPQATAAPVRSDGLLLGEYFAPFRAPAQGNEPDNPFRQHVRRAFAVDPATARRLAVPGAVVWVAADETRVCISARSALQPNGARGACARPSQILDAGLFVSGSPSPTYVRTRGLPAGTTEITGLLPDGVSNVTFTLANGSRRDVAVIANAVAVTVPSRPQRVSFRDRNNVAHSGRM